MRERREEEEVEEEQEEMFTLEVKGLMVCLAIIVIKAGLAFRFADNVVLQVCP